MNGIPATCGEWMACHCVGLPCALPSCQPALPAWFAPATGVTEAAGRGCAQDVSGQASRRAEIPADVRSALRWEELELQKACDAVGNLVAPGLE